MSNKEKRTSPKSAFLYIWRKSWWAVLLLVVALVLCFVVWQVPEGFMRHLKSLWPSIAKMLILTGLLFFFISICNRLTDYCSLKKYEKGITWFQITILIVIGLWILGFILVFDIHKESPNFLVFGIVGTLLGWIFQDTIKGVVAFIHLRLNHLLEIDDWIAVFCADCFESRKRGIDQCMKRKKQIKVWEENNDALSMSEHARWVAEKLIMGFRPLNEQELLQDEQLFGAAKKKYRNSLKKCCKDSAHIDLCSFAELRRVNPDDMKYDSFLMLAIPKTLKKLNK